VQPSPRRRLCVPAVLAVTTLTAAPACKGDDRTTASAGETSDTDSNTTTASTGTTTNPTTGETATGTDTDGVPDCKAISDQATCEATALCIWPQELLACTVDCMMITDEAICGTQQFCFWENGVCELHII
jgi:hypothetical protein